MSNEVINPYQTFDDSLGLPLEGGTVTFYTNLTTVLATIYSDEALTVPQSNPYTLDAAGRITGDVKFIGTMTLTLHDSLGAFVRTMNYVTNRANLQESITTSINARSVASYAGLRLLDVSGLTNGTTYNVTDTGIAGDFFIRNSVAHSLTDNGGTIIVIDADWYAQRVYSGAVHVNWWGATGNGTTDDTAAIQDAINFDQGVRGREVYFPPGTYGVTSNIDIDSTNTQFGLTIRGGGFNVSLITIITGFSGTGDTNCIFQIDGTSMTHHRKSFIDLSISDNGGISASGFEAVKLINGAFENDFTRVWFSTSNTHLSIDQDSLGPNVESCVFDIATNASIKDRSYKPGTYNNCIFVSAAPSNADIEMIYDTASPRAGWPKSFGGSIDNCLFLNPFRGIEFEGNVGLTIGNGNKFQCTGADATRFVQGTNSDGARVGGSYYRVSGAAGNIVSNCIALDGVKSSKIDVIFTNIDNDGISVTDCDGTDINVTADTVTGNSVIYTGSQTAGGSLSGTFINCGTTSTKNVIQCTAGSQTRILMDGMVFENTQGDNDIEASNTCYLIDNVYSAGVTETTFTGVNRPIDVFASDSSANLNSITSTVNTQYKREGRMVFNANSNRPVWPLGSAAGDLWVDATGSTAHTPVP